MSHNSDRPFAARNGGATAPALNLRDSILPAVPGQQEFTKSFLSGSQAKTAFALRLNAERMIREDGLNSTGFLTLTCGDYICKIHGAKIPEKWIFANGKKLGRCPCCDGIMNFVRVSETKEASRRFDNLNRKILSVLFLRGIVVTERHKSGDIHFHILGTIAGKPDIRTGLNFEEILDKNLPKKIRYRSAGVSIKAIWAHLRDVLPNYGFGRAELLPVRKTGEAVACYVSKYIEKNVCNRLPEDRRKKLVRYLGWEKLQLKANEFEWDGERARAWRGKSRQMLSLVGVNLPDKEFEPLPHVRRSCASAAGKIRPKFLDGTEAREILGSRWAFHLHNFIQKVSDQAVPFMVWDYLQMGIVRDELAALAGARHIRNFEREKSILMCGEIYSATEMRNFGVNYSRN